MITVFLEPHSHAWAEQIATFESEEIYMLCVPALELMAASRGCIITESMETTE
jgi:hypothetical protein